MKVVLIAKKKESECQSLMALTLLDLIFFTFASRSLSCSRSWDYRFSSLADCRWISVKRVSMSLSGVTCCGFSHLQHRMYPGLSILPQLHLEFI